jgi:hypothetical protein
MKGIRRIRLTNGKYTIVDSRDHSYLTQWTWHCLKKRSTYYAARSKYRRGKTIRIYMHREIAKRAGMSTSSLIDHRNRNGLDNRRTNLRSASQTQNRANCRLYTSNTSGFKGVSYDKRTGLWAAKLNHSGTCKWLGRFATRKEAAAAYDDAARRYFGNYANVNGVSCGYTSPLGMRRNNTSGFRGVCWIKRQRCWRACIYVNPKYVYLGYYSDKKDAARAYNRAARKYFGPRAYQNRIPGEA